MGSLGMGELVVILLIVLLVFGASRLPQLGESLGKAVRGLKRGLNSDDDIDVTKRVPEKSSADTSTSSVAEAEVVRKS
jgi:sec-independent protein translocase protein TatA